MVIQSHKTRLFLSFALLCTSSIAKADGVLEKMQAEVADLADRMRGAVVTVQDEQGVLQSSELLFLSDPLSELQQRVAKLKMESSELIRQRMSVFDRIGTVKRRTPQSEEYNKELNHLLKQQADIQGRLDRIKIEQDSAEKSLGLLRKETFAEKLGVRIGDDGGGKVPVLGDIPIISPLFRNTPKTDDTITVIGQKGNLLSSFHKQGETTVKVFVSRTGSGFSIGEGYIVTTGDVALSLRNPVVVTDNGTRMKARLVGSNPDLNIGLLRLTATGNAIPSLKLGDSASVRAGHFAVSMGNQAGQSNSVALMLVGNVRNEGTYSGKQFYPSLIQIAGTVGAGASGAPLVNVKGEVIGMMAAIPVSNPEWNTATLPPMKLEGRELGGDNAPPTVKLPYDPNRLDSVFTFVRPEVSVTSAGFAIPINQIKPIIDELRLEKPIARGWLGIAPEDVSRIVDKGNGIIDTEVVVRVLGVYPDSPAMSAGVQPGDVLVNLDGKPIRNAATIRQTSLRIRKGDTVSFTVRRGKESKDIRLKIEVRPQTIKPPITVPIKESF